MAKTGSVNLEGYALTAVITTPDATFVEFSMPRDGGATPAITFVDRGPIGLDEGDGVIVSQKMENGPNQCEHRAVDGKVIEDHGERLKKLVEGARADRGRVITQMPQSFSKGMCSIFRESYMVSGTFRPPLKLETRFAGSAYSKDELRPPAGKALDVFIPDKCDQVHSQFRYTRADSQRSLRVEVTRKTDMDEELWYENLSSDAEQLNRYYRSGEPPASALDVLYTVRSATADVPGTRYLHLDLSRNEIGGNP